MDAQNEFKLRCSSQMSWTLRLTCLSVGQAEFLSDSLNSSSASSRLQGISSLRLMLTLLSGCVLAPVSTANAHISLLKTEKNLSTL